MFKREFRSEILTLEKTEETIKDGRDLSSSTVESLTMMELEVIDLIKSRLLKEDLREIKKELLELKPSKNPKSVQFQGLRFYSLKDMLEWLEANFPTLNHALIVDLHTFLEHSYHQINPSSTL